jgi:acyl carrier protein
MPSEPPEPRVAGSDRDAAETEAYGVRWHPLTGPRARMGALEEPAAKNGTSPDAAVATGCWLILRDAGGVGDAVAQALALRGQASVRIPRCDHRAKGARDGAIEADELRRALEQRAHECSGVLFLWPLDATPGGDEVEAAGECLAGMLAVVQALALGGGAHPPRLWIVTRGAQRVTGREPMRAAQAAVWGLGRVVAAEHPELWGGLLDLDPSGRPLEDARHVCETIGGCEEDQRAWRDGVGYVPRLVRLPAAPSDTAEHSQPPEARTGCVVAAQSGGAAAWLARALVRRGVRRVGFLGPEGEIVGSGVDRDVAGGLRCAVHAVDVGLAESWARGLDALSEALGPAPTLFWLPRAGGTGSGVLLQQDPKRFVARFRELVAPTWAVFAAARRKTARVVLLSYDTALLGGPGRGAETAAAAFVEALGCGAPEVDERVAVVSAALEVDRATGTDADAAVRRRLGVAPPAPERVLRALHEAADGGPASVSLLAIDWQRHARGVYGGVVPPLLSSVLEGAGDAAASASVCGSLAARLAQAPANERIDIGLAYLQELLADVLDGDAPLELDADRGLFELGLDSLGLLQLRTRLQVALDHAIPVTAAFNYPTPRALARHLVEEVCGPVECAPTPRGERRAESDLPAVLAEIEALSDEEAAALLREALA